MSIPAASGLIHRQDSLVFDICLRLRAIALLLAAMETARAAQDVRSSANRRRLPNVTTALEHETWNQASYWAWQLHCSADLNRRRPSHLR